MQDKESSVRGAAIGIAIAAPILFLGLILTTRFFYGFYNIPTGGMEPTIKVGEKVIVKNSSEPPRRGDVIVFQYPLQTDTVFLKRVIGLPGEVVTIRDKRVSINGGELQEPYAAHIDPQIFPDQPALPEPYRSRDQFGPYTVPANAYFVMGDNRDRSSDSRYWGSVPRSLIKGAVIYVYSYRHLRAMR